MVNHSEYISAELCPKTQSPYYNKWQLFAHSYSLMMPIPASQEALPDLQVVDFWSFFFGSLFLAFTTEKRFGCRLHKYHHARNVHNGTGMRVRVNGPRFFLVKEADLEKGNPDTLVGLLSNCVCTMCLYWALLHTTVAAVESISFGSVPLQQLPLCGSQGSQLKSKTPWM